MKTEAVLRKAIFALAALPSALLADPAAVSPEAPWRPSGERAFAIDKPAAATTPNLNFSVNAKAGSFYRITWLMSASPKQGDAKATLTFSCDAGRNCFACPVSSKRALCYGYVYAPKDGQMSFSLSAASAKKSAFEARDVSVCALKAEELSDSLLLDGDFEISGDVPAGWSRSDAKTTGLSITPNTEFLAGKQCMRVEFSPEKKLGGIVSTRVPVVLGKEYTLKLWAKSDSGASFEAGVQTWSVFGHKGAHFNTAGKFRAGPEWRELSLKFQVPNDTAKFQDFLSDKTVFIFIQSGEDREVEILFDNISLTPARL